MRNIRSFIFTANLLIFAFVSGCAPQTMAEPPNARENIVFEQISLPPPIHDGTVSLEHTLYARRSRRTFSDQPLSLEHIAQLLWAAQGISIDGVTGPTRTAPSAGATHPLEVYLIVGNVNGLQPGIYRYIWDEHILLPKSLGNYKEELANIALRQQFIANAPISIVLSADYLRTTQRYGDRGMRYVYMEIGHATQNVYLQAEALGLGTVAVGAFDDEDLKTLLATPSHPLMIIPVGVLP